MYNNTNRTHHASGFYAQPGGTFHLWSVFMYQYPKQILTIAQQVQSYIDAGIFSQENVETALKSIGFIVYEGIRFTYMITLLKNIFLESSLKIL